MIRRRVVVGLSLLSALLFCAIAAQSASAIVTTKSTNTTAFTCVKGGGGDFTDAHCDNSGKGEYGHEAVPLNETKSINGTNQKVTNSTKDNEPIVLKGTIGIAKLTIECSTMQTTTEKSAVHNVELTDKQHTMTGNGTALFTNCSVNELAKCAVSEPIAAAANFHGVQGMEGPKGESNAMGVEFTGAGGEETFAEIQFINKGAEACSLNGKTFPVKGRVVGTSGPTTESVQNNKGSGATIVLTSKAKMQTLKLGPNNAELSMIVTATGSGGGNHPIAVTTTT